MMYKNITFRFLTEMNIILKNDILIDDISFQLKGLF